jgi:hypothetical protein
MQERRLITCLGTNDIETLIQGMPLILVACIRDINDHGILDKLKTTAVHIGPHLEVCYALDDLMPYFEKRYNVCGTPTFLLIRDGAIADVLLGNQTAKDIVAWAEPLAQDPKRTMMSLWNRVPAGGQLARLEVGKSCCNAQGPERIRGCEPHLASTEYSESSVKAWHKS